MWPLPSTPSPASSSWWPSAIPEWNKESNDVAEDHRRAARVQRPYGAGEGARDLRGVHPPAAVREQADPRALERRVVLDPDGRLRDEPPVREPHEPPGPRRDPLVPGRLQRDGDPLPLRRL